MRSRVLFILLFFIILVGCGDGTSESKISNDKSDPDYIRQEVLDEAIKIANAVNYFVDSKTIVPTAINLELSERWFSDSEPTDKENELYSLILKLVMSGRGIVQTNFAEFNVDAYSEYYDGVIEIIGEDSIADEYLDMAFVRYMEEAEDEFQLEQKESTPLILEDTSCNNDGNFAKTRGFIKNNDSVSHTYVRVEVTYLDDNDNVIDTDWTYAVDSQPLKPNDRRSYEITSPKNDQITKCKQKITD